jgi:hypothetical protein
MLKGQQSEIELNRVSTALHCRRMVEFRFFKPACGPSRYGPVA